MKHFPEFMKSHKNKNNQAQQNADDLEGYLFEGADGLQIAFGECHSNQKSQKHIHDIDEYMICVSGEYTAYFNGKEIILSNGAIVNLGLKQYMRVAESTF